MKTFGTLVSEARRAKGLSQKDLAAKVKKEDGQAISAQYLNDIEHDRRNPPSEFLIGQIAGASDVSEDVLCLAAGTIPNDLRNMATTRPQKVEPASKISGKRLKTANRMKWVRDKTGRFAQRPHYLPRGNRRRMRTPDPAFLRKKYGKVEFPVKTDDLTVFIEESAVSIPTPIFQARGEVEGVTEFASGKRPVVKIASRAERAQPGKPAEYHDYPRIWARPLSPLHVRRPSEPAAVFVHAADPGSRQQMSPRQHDWRAERDWMEWQAGYACGAILMPAVALVETVKRFREEKKLPYANLAGGFGARPAAPHAGYSDVPNFQGRRACVCSSEGS